MLTRRFLLASSLLLPATGMAQAADVVRLNEVPLHLQLVIQSVAERVAGFVTAKDEAAVEYSAAALAAFKNLAVRPIGFKLMDATIRGLSIPKKTKVPRIALDGALTYTSSGARRAIVAFTVIYAIVGSRVRVEFAALTPVLPDKPMVMLYVLPGSVREDELRPTDATFEAVLARIVAQAYDLRKPNEFADGGYLMAAAVFDWLPDTIPMNLWISDDPEKIDPTGGLMTLAYFGGWRIYLRRSDLAFADKRKNYMKLAWSKPAAELISAVQIAPASQSLS